MAGKTTSGGTSSGFTVDVKIMESQAETIKECASTLGVIGCAIESIAASLPYDVGSDADIKNAIKKVLEATEKECTEVRAMGQALSNIQKNYETAENEILGIDDPLKRFLLKLIGGGIADGLTDGGVSPYGFDYDSDKAKKKKWPADDDDADGKKKSGDSDDDDADGKKKSGDSDDEDADGKKKSGDSDEDADGKKKSGDSDDEDADGKKKSGDSDDEDADGKKKSGDSDDDDADGKKNGESDDDSDGKKKGPSTDIKYEKSVGVEKSAYSKSGQGSYGIASGEYEVKAGTAEASAAAGISKENGAYANVGVGITGASATVKGQLGNDNLGVHGEATVKAASAAATAQVSVGKDGISAGAEATAVLASAEGKAGVDIAGTDVDVVGSVGVGVGAKANVTVKGGKVSAELGAYLGVGADIKVEIDVSGTVDKAKDAWTWASDKIAGWF